MEQPLLILEKYWGYKAFRGKQAEIIAHVLSGQDTLAILPTGGGKSICFQVPALALGGLCLVVSPLIALMKDQVDQLRKRDISAAYLHGGLAQFEVNELLAQAEQGELSFLYVSPERIQSTSFRNWIEEAPIALIAIDEAHCISQWGYDFRPSYTKLSSLRSLLRKHVPIIALTASATDRVQEDIIQQLQLQSPKVFRQSFLRPNLSFSAFAPESKIGRTIEILQKVPGSALVYCNSRKKTVDIAKLIQQHGIAVSHFHAGLTLQEKEKRQNAWIKNELRVMVCTNAFGMGIDKSDVRLVIHFDVPDCLENYYQEAGRAGRDGQKAYAVLLYSDQDLQQLEESVEQKFPTIPILKQLYQKMGDFLQVPAGSGEGFYYDFDWEQFLQQLDFDAKLTKNGLKHIEQEGFIIVEESVFIPSKVQVLASRDEYETFTNAQPKLLDVIMVLLRNYQGIVDQSVSISERKLAKWLSIEEASVRMQLLLLHSAGIISYIYKKETPQLYFVTNRAPAAHLNINNERYLKRKELYSQRTQKMIGYTHLESGCRNFYIAAYFDDPDAQACGICDLCLQQKKKPLTVEEIDTVYEVLEKSTDPLSAASIAKMTVTISETKVLEALRRLKDEQVVDQVEKGFVVYKKTARRRS